jgi:hypothetical protein
MSQPNPLDTDKQFYMSLANPNPTSSKTKDGPVYRVSFEMAQGEWQQFMDAVTKGMVIECACQVTHRNNESVKRDPDTVDAFDESTDNEKLKGGPLSVRSDALARDPNFYEFIKSTEPAYIHASEGGIVKKMRQYIRARCHVESRAELDHDKEAADKFKKLISSYTQWSVRNGYTQA